MSFETHRSGNTFNSLDNTIGSNENTAPSVVPVRKSSRKKKILLCCCLFLLIIIILAIVLPLLYVKERPVNFTIDPLQIGNATMDTNPDGFTLPVDPRVIADNRNFFDIHVDQIQVKGSHPGYGKGQSELGIGLSGPVFLRKRSETDFTFPFLITYKRALDPDFEFLGDILNNCSTSGLLTIDLDIQINYHMWAKSGDIFEKRQATFDCPISESEAASLKLLVAAFGSSV